MAEFWPTLKRKLACDHVRRKKKTSSSRLAKLAAFLKGVHSKSKKASLVERVSAAHSLSRSAQEWTARTLSRRAEEGSKSPEIVLLQCSAVSQTRSSAYAERLSCAEARFTPDEEKSEATVSEDRQSQEAAIALPLRRPGRCMKTIRRSLQRNSSSASVALLALGAFISSRFRKIKNSLAAVLTFNLWRRGRFVFSSVGLHILTPLRSYLTYCPRRLSLGQLRNTRTHLSSQNPGSSLVLLPLEPSPAPAAPLSLLLKIPETPASSATGASSPPRRLVKKVASRFKKLKMFRSKTSPSSALSTPSTASSEVGSPVPPSSPCKCPFSRRLHKSKTDIPSEFGDEESNRSRLSTMSSSETLDIGEIITCPEAATPTSVSWPMVGFLVTLLFLLVGRVPAIMATSLFLVVVSIAHHDRAHPRSRRASEAARKLQPGSPRRKR